MMGEKVSNSGGSNHYFLLLNFSYEADFSKHDNCRDSHERVFEKKRTLFWLLPSFPPRQTFHRWPWKENFNDLGEVLVIAGDTLFQSDFDLKTFIDRFKELNTPNVGPLALIGNVLK